MSEDIHPMGLGSFEANEDEAPLPSEPILSEEETARQLRADSVRGYTDRIAALEKEFAEAKAWKESAAGSNLVACEENNAELSAENDRLRAALAESEKWKNEDPRMLREQIRVADKAFNSLQERFNKSEAALAELRKVAEELAVQPEGGDDEAIRAFHKWQKENPE